MQKKATLKTVKKITGLQKARMMAYAGQNKKAIQPIVLDVREISGVTDYYVIMSGNTDTQVKAIVNEIDRVCHEEKIVVQHTEGSSAATWILIDLNDVVVHVFTQKERHYYALEKLWKAAKIVKVAQK